MQVKGIDAVGPNEFGDVPQTEAFPHVSKLMDNVQSKWIAARVTSLDEAMEVARSVINTFNANQYKYVAGLLGVQHEEQTPTGVTGQFGLSFKYRVLN